MAVDDDPEQQPGNAATHGVHQDPADPDEGGFLVTLRADLSDEDVDAVAQSIEEVSGIQGVRRSAAGARGGHPRVAQTGPPLPQEPEELRSLPEPPPHDRRIPQHPAGRWP